MRLLGSITRKFFVRIVSLGETYRIVVVESFINLLPAPCKPTVYDCFLFNDELELLSLRIKELYNAVDYFVICECSASFSGEEKPLLYHSNRDLFAAYSDKILHFIIPDPPSNAYVINPANPARKTSEFWQRDGMAEPLQRARDKDLILISDLDEIPNQDMLGYVHKLVHWANCPVYLAQKWYLLFLNSLVLSCQKTVFGSRHRFANRDNAEWIGSFACTKKLLCTRYNWRINSIWAEKWGEHNLAYPVVEGGGWHFSYMGGMSKMNDKIRALASKAFTSSDALNIVSGLFADCVLNTVQLDGHPRSIQDNPESWEHLMAHENSFQELSFMLRDGL